MQQISKLSRTMSWIIKEGSLNFRYCK